MASPKIRKILPFAAALLAAFFLFRAVAGVNRSLESGALKILSSIGAPEAAIEKISTRGGVVAIGPVRLDKDGFSVIDSITVPLPLTDRLLRKPIRRAEISGMTLTGEVRKEGSWSISGWEGRNAGLPDLDEVRLESGRIDVMTPSGVIRMDVSGTLLRQPGGAWKISAAARGAQRQLTADSRWEISIRDGGTWRADATLLDGRGEFGAFRFSRAAGWLAFDKTPGNPLPEASGQVTAGSAAFGPVAFSSATFTVDKNRTIINGNIAGREGMKVFVDISPLPGGLAVEASIRTASLDDLLSFLQDVRAAGDSGILPPSLVTPFLLTAGNLNRMKKEIESAPYDMLELRISGAESDMTGTITATKQDGGANETRVVSLNPAE